MHAWARKQPACKQHNLFIFLFCFVRSCVDEFARGRVAPDCRELDCSGGYGPCRCAALHFSLFLGQASQKLNELTIQIRLVLSFVARLILSCPWNSTHYFPVVTTGTVLAILLLLRLVGPWSRCSRLHSLIARPVMARAAAQRFSRVRSSWAKTYSSLKEATRHANGTLPLCNALSWSERKVGSSQVGLRES